MSIDPNTKETVVVGRRKSATARVRLQPGSGKIIVNGKDVTDYLEREVLVQNALRPFEVTETSGTFDVRARCDGGGKSGQAGALRLGIARGLVAIDENMRKTLRNADLLTRDAREVERKKYGQPGARKNFQFSKR